MLYILTPFVRQNEFNHVYLLMPHVNVFKVKDLVKFMAALEVQQVTVGAPPGLLLK